jgi:hypothetical protein
MARNGVRKAVFGLAIAAFAAALAVLGAAFWAVANLGGDHVVTAALFSSSVFCACCGVVLYFMSKPPQTLPPP